MVLDRGKNTIQFPQRWLNGPQRLVVLARGPNTPHTTTPREPETDNGQPILISRRGCACKSKDNLTQYSAST